MPDHVPTSTAVEVDRVEISVPFRTDYLSTLRTLAAALGADAGFSIDEIDDLRLAISEVVASIIDRAAPPGGAGASDSVSDDRIEVTFETGADQIAASISTQHRAHEVVLDELATGILSSVVDEHESVGGTVRIVKRAAEATGARSAT